VNEWLLLGLWAGFIGLLKFNAWIKRDIAETLGWGRR
jgi:hypothetical protein